MELDFRDGKYFGKTGQIYIAYKSISFIKVKNTEFYVQTYICK